MITELGHFALILAFLCSFLHLHHAYAAKAALVQFIAVTVSFLTLMWAYIVTDLSVLNVVQNSHSLKPLLYKVAGTWGNHEGSMLLWVFILSLFGFMFAISKKLPPALKASTLAVQGLLSAGFIGYTLFASSPFARIPMPPVDGQDLNPLLQDPALAIHPPLLYLGYVGFSAVFSLAIAGLWAGTIDKNWAKLAKPWILLAWTSLSAGIALGSWWAYYELGWGGWWFWDPVENASLLPWLLGAALMHSVLVMQKRGGLKRWTILLAILTFSLSMLGTFLVRSGVLSSVHAFALDPERGVFILALLVLYTGGGLLLYGLRAAKLDSTVEFNILSRETMLIINNLFIATITATVMIGTLYPLVLSTLGLGDVSVGPPYFHATVIPLAIPMVILMAMAPLIPWKKAQWNMIFPHLKAMALWLVAIIALVIALQTPKPFLSVVGIGLGAWLIFGTLRYLYTRRKRLSKLPLYEWGLTFAHMGLGVAILGMTGTGLWSEQKTELMQAGQQINIGRYEVTLETIETTYGANYSALRATFSADNNAITIASEKRYYPVADKATTEVAIHTSWRDDLYIALGANDTATGGFVVQLWSHPLVPFLWTGFLMIVLGGSMSFVGSVRSHEPIPTSRPTSRPASRSGSEK